MGEVYCLIIHHLDPVCPIVRAHPVIDSITRGCRRPDRLNVRHQYIAVRVDWLTHPVRGSRLGGYWITPACANFSVIATGPMEVVVGQQPLTIVVDSVTVGWNGCFPGLLGECCRGPADGENLDFITKEAL